MKLDEILKDVRVGEQTTLDITGGEKDRKLTVELRKLLPEPARAPTRAESPPRAHVFFSAESLGAYLAKYGGEHTVVYADPGAETIYAVLDESAGNGFEAVTMRPQVHPLWAPWAAIAGRKISLAAFAEHVDQNRRAITKPDGRELRMLLSQIRASVSVEIERGRGKNAVNGLVVRTKIQGVEKNEAVELPEEIEVDVPLYVDTPKERIPLDLCIEADTSGAIYVLVSAGTVADARVRAFEAMIDEIAMHEGVKKLGATITFGKPAHAAWAYLRELDGAAK